jgi:hypothetical protein
VAFLENIMSLIESLRPKAAVHKPQVPDILRKLETARAELASIATRHAEAALDALTGGADAIAALDSVNRELGMARERIENLSAAHKAAIDRDQAAARAQRASLQRTQINALRKHLEMRDQAAIALADIVGKFSVEYRKLVDHSAKAVGACPLGYEWPDGVALCIPDEIKVVVGAELWRVADVRNPHEYRNGEHPLAPPGAAADQADFIGYPTRTPPLAERIARATSAILARLELPRAK